MSNNQTNPWENTANQAVGALYKYYTTRPTESDQMKAQLQQAQLEEMQRGQALGDFTTQNLSPEIRNDLYRRKLLEGGDTSGAQLFGAYVNKPMQLDAGDTKYIVDGATGLPLQRYGVGVAPDVQYDAANNRTITTPAMPSMDRPSATPIAEMFGSSMTNNSGVIPADKAAVLGQIPPMNEGQFAVKQNVSTPTPPPQFGGFDYNSAQFDGGYPPTLEQQKQDKARASVTNTIGEMANDYRQLNAQGGAISPDQKALTQNLPNAVMSSKFGQVIGRATGSETQTLRDNIAAQKPALMAAIRQASDMGVKGMDSEKELQFYLNAIGDPSLSVETNLAALQALNDNLGLGSDKFSNPVEVEKIRQAAKQSLSAPTLTQDGTGPVQVQSDDDYNSLPSGTVFIDPTGQRRVKP